MVHYFICSNDAMRWQVNFKSKNNTIYPIIKSCISTTTFIYPWRIDRACENGKKNGVKYWNTLLRRTFSFKLTFSVLAFLLVPFPGLSLVNLLAICTLVELLSMWNLTRIEVQLCNMLSPEAPQLSLATYNWCLVSIFSCLFFMCLITSC